MKIQDKKFTLLRVGENSTEIFLEDNFEKVTRSFSSASEDEIKSILCLSGYTESLIAKKRAMELHVYCQDISSDDEIEFIESLSPREREEYLKEDIEELQVS